MLTLEIHNLSFCFIIPISNGHNFMVSGATLIVLKYDGVVLKCDSLERLAVLHKQCCWDANVLPNYMVPTMVFGPICSKN